MAIKYTNPSGMTGSGFQAYDGNTGIIASRLMSPGTNMAITNQSGVGGPPVFSALTTVPVYPYYETAGPVVLVTAARGIIGIDCSGAPVGVTLSATPTSAGSVWTIKDTTGSAATNNITIAVAGGIITIDGAASYVLNVAYAAASFLWTGTAYIVI